MGNLETKQIIENTSVGQSIGQSIKVGNVVSGGSISMTTGSESSMISSDHEKVTITNGNIDIKTKNINKVLINGDKCVPCVELKKFCSENDSKIDSFLRQYCNN